MFVPAVKEQEKARVALEGPAGSGKTVTALRVARALVGPEGKIAALDTERRSMRKYAALPGVAPDNVTTFAFDLVEVAPPFHPTRMIEAIKSAEAAGYDAFVADSLSHFWNDEGGMLEIVERVAKAKYRGNTFNAWNDPEVGGVQKAFVNAILDARIHVLATMRTKVDYVVETNERGKAEPRKVGTKSIQREGFDYEFDVIGRLDTANILTITKTRCAALSGKFFEKPGPEVAEILAEWLGSGESTRPSDDQKARLDAALSSGAAVDADRFSVATAERAAGRDVRAPARRSEARRVREARREDRGRGDGRARGARGDGPH
jgi:KaiC/GvpD/RAD55 family RecA-like ATPase